MTFIAVTNKSTLVSDADVRAMTRACATQLRRDASPLWDKPACPVAYLSNVADAPPGAWLIAVLDDDDQAGALGWHTEERNELIYGRVFARPVLDNGGDALHKPLSVASVLSHEVLETWGDPHANLWADTGRGFQVAFENCDPVESDSYEISVSRLAKPVTVSNFVTPAWFDPEAKFTDRFDYMNKVRAPFTMTEGGYWVEMADGTVTQNFGRTFPAWRKDGKFVPASRMSRRI